MEIKIQKLDAAGAVDAKKPLYFIVAGHRGKGTGAHGYFDEAEEAISLRDAIMAHMKLRGCTCVKDDDKAQLSNVVRWVNGICTADDICLDIHFNASSNASATGVEAYVRAENTKVAEKAIAKRLVDAIARVLGIGVRGVKLDNTGAHTRLAMCRDVRCKSVLLEVCFCTSPKDAAAYNQHKVELARAIAEALMNN